MDERTSRCLTAKKRLHGDRGKQPSAYSTTGRGKNKHVQFHPCEKGMVYGAALQSAGCVEQEAYRNLHGVDCTMPIENVRALAAATPCSCHSGWTTVDLQAVEEGRDPGRAVTVARKGKTSEIDSEVARACLEKAYGDKQTAWSYFVIHYGLKPPCNASDLYAWYDSNL